MGFRSSATPSHAGPVTQSQVGTPHEMMCAHCCRSISWSGTPHNAISHSKVRVMKVQDLALEKI